MISISEQSQEIYDGLGHVYKIKVDNKGATIYNGIECERLRGLNEENLTTVAEVNYLAKEAQDRAPRLVGTKPDTLDEFLE